MYPLVHRKLVRMLETGSSPDFGSLPFRPFSSNYAQWLNCEMLPVTVARLRRMFAGFPVRPLFGVSINFPLRHLFPSIFNCQKQKTPGELTQRGGNGQSYPVFQPPTSFAWVLGSFSGSSSGSDSSLTSPSRILTFSGLVKFAHPYSGGTASAFDRFLY